MNVRRFRHWLFVVASSCAAFAGSPDAFALNESPVGEADEEPRLRSLVDSWAAADAFRGSVSVSRGDRKVAELAVGTANTTGMRNGPDSLYRIGSISKTFAAAAIMRLVEQARLRLDDPLDGFLPEYPRANLEKNGERVRIRHLLNHTSGIRSADRSVAMFARARRGPAPAEEALGVVRNQPLESVPGAEFRYNNTGYDLLGLIIERVTGRRFGEYVRQDLLLAEEREAIGVSEFAESPAMTTGYYYTGFGWVTCDWLLGAMPRSIPDASASGNLVASAPALHSWFARLVRGRVLAPESLRAMTTPGLDEYGLGLIVDTKNGHRRITHAGAILGYVSNVEYFPDDDVVITILGNVDLKGVDLSRLAGQVRDIVLEHTTVEGASRIGAVSRVESFVLAALEFVVFGKTLAALVLKGVLTAALLLGLYRNRIKSRFRSLEETLLRVAILVAGVAVEAPPWWLSVALLAILALAAADRLARSIGLPNRDSGVARHASGIAVVGLLLAALLASVTSRPLVVEVLVATLAALALQLAWRAYRARRVIAESQCARSVK